MKEEYRQELEERLTDLENRLEDLKARKEEVAKHADYQDWLKRIAEQEKALQKARKELAAL